MPLQVYSAKERSTTIIPIQQILSKEGTPYLYPEVLSKQYFDIKYRSNELVLVAGKYIGLIPLNENIAINVKPKVPIKSLIHIISKAGGSLDFLEFFMRQYLPTQKADEPIFELLARSLVVLLRKLDEGGVYKEYLEKSENSTTPRGRMNFRKTAAHNWPRGKFSKIYIDFYEFTADTPLNRMIKFALWYCLNCMTKFKSSDVNLIRQLHFYYGFFGTVLLDKNRLFSTKAKDLIENNKIPPLRHYYINICKLCSYILEQAGIQVNEEVGEIQALSFVIDMETMFENYVRNVLRDSVLILKSALMVYDGNKEGKGFLFQDNKRYEAKPDIILKNGDQCRLLIEVKYKTKLQESDRYQVIAHSLSYSANRAVLLVPYDGQPQRGLVKLGSIGDIEVYEYYYNLESQNLDLEEQLYCETMAGLCHN